jgi:hypothetical protein
MHAQQTLEQVAAELNNCMTVNVVAVKPVRAVPASATWRMMKSGREGWSMYSTATRDYIIHDTHGPLLVIIAPATL